MYNLRKMKGNRNVLFGVHVLIYNITIKWEIDKVMKYPQDGP